MEGDTLLLHFLNFAIEFHIQYFSIVGLLAGLYLTTRNINPAVCSLLSAGTIGLCLIAWAVFQVGGFPLRGDGVIALFPAFMYFMIGFPIALTLYYILFKSIDLYKIRKKAGK